MFSILRLRCCSSGHRIILGTGVVLLSSPNLDMQTTHPGRSDCFFVSDLHGKSDRYQKLLSLLAAQCPAALFLGGDLLPSYSGGEFTNEFLLPAFARLRADMGDLYPRVFMILGNDDPRCEEKKLKEGEGDGLWNYLHSCKKPFRENTVYGYSCVPPTPFRLKDWERYDVSRYCDPGCFSPEEGAHSTTIDEHETKWGTIANDLMNLVNEDKLDSAIVLFHAPPYDTPLDRAALDGVRVDHVPLDVHVGSIAIRRFIEARQPLLTLHGHVHESARLTGIWKIHIGRTVCLNAAHDGPELALVRFNLEDPSNATRELL